MRDPVWNLWSEVRTNWPARSGFVFLDSMNWITRPKRLADQIVAAQTGWLDPS